MRVSTDMEDIGFRAETDIENRGAILAIYLDGVKQEYVVTADSDEGIIIRLKRYPDGAFVVSGDEIVRETLNGDVRIETI